MKRLLFLAFLALVAGGLVRLPAANPPAPAAAAGSASASIPANPFGPKPATGSAPATGNAITSPDLANYTPDKFVETLRAMLLQRFDQDHNGKLDPVELAEARALFNGGRPQPNAPAAGNGPLFGLRGAILANFGKGAADTLSAAEMARLHDFLFGPTPSPAQLDALRAEVFKQFNKNGDNKLDATEAAAAKAALQQLIAELDQGSFASPAKPPPAATANAEPAMQ